MQSRLLKLVFFAGAACLCGAPQKGGVVSVADPALTPASADVPFTRFRGTLHAGDPLRRSPELNFSWRLLRSQAELGKFLNTVEKGWTDETPVDWSRNMVWIEHVRGEYAVEKVWTVKGTLHISTSGLPERPGPKARDVTWVAAIVPRLEGGPVVFSSFLPF